MEYFLNELYGSEVQNHQQKSNQYRDRSNERLNEAVISLSEKKHNLPEICIEIDM